MPPRAFQTTSDKSNPPRLHLRPLPLQPNRAPPQPLHPPKPKQPAKATTRLSTSLKPPLRPAAVAALGAEAQEPEQGELAAAEARAARAPKPALVREEQLPTLATWGTWISCATTHNSNSYGRLCRRSHACWSPSCSRWRAATRSSRK